MEVENVNRTLNGLSNQTSPNKLCVMAYTFVTTLALWNWGEGHWFRGQSMGHSKTMGGAGSRGIAPSNKNGFTAILSNTLRSNTIFSQNFLKTWRNTLLDSSYEASIALLTTKTNL